VPALRSALVLEPAFSIVSAMASANASAAASVMESVLAVSSALEISTLAPVWN